LIAVPQVLWKKLLWSFHISISALVAILSTFNPLGGPFPRYVSCSSLLLAPYSTPKYFENHICFLFVKAITQLEDKITDSDPLYSTFSPFAYFILSDKIKTVWENLWCVQKLFSACFYKLFKTAYENSL